MTRKTVPLIARRISPACLDVENPGNPNDLTYPGTFNRTYPPIGAATPDPSLIGTERLIGSMAPFGASPGFEVKAFDILSERNTQTGLFPRRELKWAVASKSLKLGFGTSGNADPVLFRTAPRPDIGTAQANFDFGSSFLVAGTPNEPFWQPLQKQRSGAFPSRKSFARKWVETTKEIWYDPEQETHLENVTEETHYQWGFIMDWPNAHTYAQLWRIEDGEVILTTVQNASARIHLMHVIKATRTERWEKSYPPKAIPQRSETRYWRLYDPTKFTGWDWFSGVASTYQGTELNVTIPTAETGTGFSTFGTQQQASMTLEELFNNVRAREFRYLVQSDWLTSRSRTYRNHYKRHRANFGSIDPTVQATDYKRIVNLTSVIGSGTTPVSTTFTGVFATKTYSVPRFPLRYTRGNEGTKRATVPSSTFTPDPLPEVYGTSNVFDDTWNGFRASNGPGINPTYYNTQPASPILSVAESIQRFANHITEILGPVAGYTGTETPPSGSPIPFSVSPRPMPLTVYQGNTSEFAIQRRRWKSAQYEEETIDPIPSNPETLSILVLGSHTIERDKNDLLQGWLADLSGIPVGTATPKTSLDPLRGRDALSKISEIISGIWISIEYEAIEPCIEEADIMGGEEVTWYYEGGTAAKLNTFTNPGTLAERVDIALQIRFANTVGAPQSGNLFDNVKYALPDTILGEDVYIASPSQAVPVFETTYEVGGEELSHNVLPVPLTRVVVHTFPTGDIKFMGLGAPLLPNIPSARNVRTRQVYAASDWATPSPNAHETRELLEGISLPD